MCATDQPQALSRDEALQLFKMYEDKGWAVKQQMIAIVSWLTPFIFGLIVFSFSARNVCSSNVDPTSGLATFTAVLLSVFMVFLVIGSLRHADLDYWKADEVLQRTKDRFPAKERFPSEILDLIQFTPKRWWLPDFIRFGMLRIGGVHIFLMYLAFFILVCSITAWKPPKMLLGWFCPGGG